MVDPAPDPGMAVKMAPPGLAGLDRLLAGEPIREQHVLDLCDFVDARLDCSDFRVLTLLRIAASGNAHLSPALLRRVRATLLGFRYWMDEQGTDSMCFWSENHQVIFATCEYLAGQLHPDEQFHNPGPGGVRLTGRERMARAQHRLDDWLTDRFRYGFTEWLSPTYYEEDAAALALLVELCDDRVLAGRARTVLDLLMLDLALHHFDGLPAASAGRAYEAQKKDPTAAEVTPLIRRCLLGEAGAVPLDRLAGLVVTSGYEVPEAIRAVARARPAADGETILESFGLDLHEVARQVAPPRSTRAGLFFWLMEAFTTPESIRVTMDLLERWRMDTNRFLAPLAAFRRVPSWLLPRLVRWLNPATQGVAIQRADVTTWRTPHVQLSSAQNHQPGGFGDQQHLWQATLPGGVPVFATHPGAPMFDDASRNFSPSAWVGNGINPALGQDGPVLLALWDLRRRRGYLERERLHSTHLYWPRARFDADASGHHVSGGTWLAARVGEGYVGVVCTAALRPGSEAAELVADGEVTGWVVTVGDSHLDGEFADFCRRTSSLDVGLDTARPARLVAGTRRLTDNGMTVDGRSRSSAHPRFESPRVRATRFPERIAVECGGERWSADAPGMSDVATRAIERAVALADSVVATQSRPAPWMWGPALLGHAMLGLDEQLGGEPRYRDHVLRYARHHVANPPRIDYSDHVAPALVTFALQQLGHDEFAPLTTRAIDYVRGAPRVVDDAVNHLGRSGWDRIYPASVWVDSLMMFSLLPATYGRVTGDAELLDLAARQPVQYARRMQDPATGLWHHSYWVRLGRPYPRALWGRGNGWVVAALPQILDQLPPNHPERAPIVDLLRSTSEALLARQREDGTWTTVLGPRPGGYRELSTTALVSAGWLHSVRCGYLPETYRQPGMRALAAVTEAIEDVEGRLVLPEISGPTIPVPVFGRLGYLLTPTGRNHPWGVAAFLMAATQAARLRAPDA